MNLLRSDLGSRCTWCSRTPNARGNLRTSPSATAIPLYSGSIRALRRDPGPVRSERRAKKWTRPIEAPSPGRGPVGGAHGAQRTPLIRRARWSGPGRPGAAPRAAAAAVAVVRSGGAVGHRSEHRHGHVQAALARGLREVLVETVALRLADEPAVDRRIAQHADERPGDRLVVLEQSLRATVVDHE